MSTVFSAILKKVKFVNFSSLREQNKSASLEQKFTDIYLNNSWGDPESVSGPGSGLERTLSFRDKIPDLLQEIGARSLLDAPCGDFNWMKEVKLDLKRYIGIDIVPALIRTNIEKYGGRGRTFYHCDLIQTPLPKVDVIFCRDCLVHFSINDIKRAISNFKKSGSLYLLTNSFVNLEINSDIATGDWRQINLEKPPFNFPKPLKMIDEHCTHTNGIYRDKQLALWELATLPGF
jgi:hypothetical protein